MAITCTTMWNMRGDLPNVLLTSSDKLDKVIKFIEGIYRGFHEFITALPINDVFKNTSKLLTSIVLFSDFEYWTKVKDGIPAFFTDLKQDTVKFIRTAAIHISHLFTTLSFLKDVGVEFLGQLDRQMGKLTVFGAQLGFKLVKDFALIVACSFSLGSIFNSILMDKSGKARDLVEVVKSGKLGSVITEEKVVGIVNNITKIYVIAGVSLGVPYDPLFFVMGFLLGVTNIIQYALKYSQAVEERVKAYEVVKPIYDRIPSAPERLMFAKA